MIGLVHIKTWHSLPVALLTVGAAIFMFQSPAPAADNADSSGSGQGPTFTKDVAPILQTHCQECHRSGAVAPMSLMTYQDARPWARSIKQRVVQRTMPPWFVERNVGIQKFKDDPSLSDREIATLVRWVDAGAPQGNPADMPPPAKLSELGAWQIGKPDLIVAAPAHTIPAQAPDTWLDLYSDSGLTEDRYIKAVQGMPSYPKGFRVVHHSHNYLIPPGGTEENEGMEREETLNEYSAGKPADIFPEGSGRLMKAGTRIHFNIHYHAVGEEIHDQFKIGLTFYPKGYVPKHIQQSGQFDQSQIPGGLDIPAGADNVRSDMYHRFNTAVTLTGFQPHMHDRGKRECLEAIYPDGKNEMLNCADFNFGWALVYEWADDAAPILPAGSILHIINWHDNSDRNPANPDSRNWVGSGARTIDEMSFVWLFWYNMSDDEYKQISAERQARRIAGKMPNLLAAPGGTAAR
ncbi:MAG TPA: hypothetical protein VG273_19925 [Bryobacteraceae bacterium]|jgi:hypothetical protein|nr:hypothetical protein [Bryobacteraceae bacterium]